MEFQLENMAFLKDNSTIAFGRVSLNPETDGLEANGIVIRLDNDGSIVWKTELADMYDVVQVMPSENELLVTAIDDKLQQHSICLNMRGERIQ